MLERLLADALTRVLGQYVRGITRDSINFGVWNGNLELRDLELHSEALGILFETFGLDLPVTIRRGFIGLLRLEVPWKYLRSAPVRVVMENVTVVAVPSSEADADALQDRASRLKRARLGADDAVREATWGAESLGTRNSEDGEGQNSAASSSSWGWNAAGKMMNKVVDNIQIEIGDIWIQYEDGVSDPERPFAAGVRLKRLAVQSTDEQWNKVFIDETKGGLVHKKIDLLGLSLDWDPISTQDSSEPKLPNLIHATSSTTAHGLAQVLESASALRSFLKTGAVQRAYDYNHVISPVDGSLRVQLRRSLRPGEEPPDDSVMAMVVMDLELPDLRLAMNEFQYGTFLRMIWHMGEFSKTGTRSNRPQTAKERWLWAADQVLPDYRQHFRDAWLRTPAGMREYRTKLLVHTALRLPILQTRRSGKTPDPTVVARMEEYEEELSLEECMRYRDFTEYQYSCQEGQRPKSSRLWRYFERTKSSRSEASKSKKGQADAALSPDESYSSDEFHSAIGSDDDPQTLNEIAKLRMGILVRKGSIALAYGGMDGVSEPMSKLQLTGLQIGFQTREDQGTLIEGMLQNIEVTDSESDGVIMGARVTSMQTSATQFPSGTESLFPKNVSDVLTELRSTWKTSPPNPGSAQSMSRSSSSSWFGSHGSEETGAGSLFEQTAPCSHIAALRMKMHPDTVLDDLDVEGASASMELCIGGLDGVINGPKGSFVASWGFWTPSSEPEPMMAFLTSATASKIVALRMRIQQTLLARTKPMNLAIDVHAPRLIIPGASRDDPALVADFGRFSFDSMADDAMLVEGSTPLEHITYRMAIESAGLFIVESQKTMKPVHLLMRPVTSTMKLRSLQNASFIEAAAVHQHISAAKTALRIELPAVNICLPQKGYRKLLSLARTWGESISRMGRTAMAAAVTLSESPETTEGESPKDAASQVRDLEMDLILGECSVELRDKHARRLVMFRASGSSISYIKDGGGSQFSFDTHSFAILDGTQGTPAPLQKLAFAGSSPSKSQDSESVKSFVKICYSAEKSSQKLDLSFLSLNIVCLKEAYVELARFIFEVAEGVYQSPLEAAGISVNEAAQTIKETGKDVVERGTAALAQRGALKVSLNSDGVHIVVADTNGPIGDVNITLLRAEVSETESRGFECKGSIGGVLIRDLISKIHQHREVVRYSNPGNEDGWGLSIPPRGSGGDPWFRAQFHRLTIVFVQKFLRTLRYYVASIVREIHRIIPSSGEKLDWGEVFAPLNVLDGDWTPPSMRELPRLRLKIEAKDVDLLLPRNSEDRFDALRLVIPETTITNHDAAAEGYKIGIEMTAADISGYILFPDPTAPTPEAYDLQTPSSTLNPFMQDNKIIIKIDWWRKGNQLGDVETIRAALSREEEGDLDAHYRLPSLRARIAAPNGIHSTLSEADYSVLYLVLTENVFERVKDDDLLPVEIPATVTAGLVLPPIIRVVFDIPVVTGVIAKGTDHTLEENVLVESRLCSIQGSVDYGVDYRISASLSANVDFVNDRRGGRIDPPCFVCGRGESFSGKASLSQDLDFSYDRGFRQKANLMLVVSGLTINLIPELSLTMADLTLPGNPFLPTTSFPDLPPFFGRNLILTISHSDLWIKTEEFSGDLRAMVIRGDFLTKVQWMPTTRERSLELVCRSLGVSLGDTTGILKRPSSDGTDSEDEGEKAGTRRENKEVAFLYPCSINVDVTPDSIFVGGDNILLRIAVNDTPLFLALTSRLGKAFKSHEERLRELYVEIPVVLFGDQEVLSTKVSLAMARVVITDEYGGKYVPIMELRASNTTLEGRLPWMMKCWSRFSVDLFDDVNGWWVPGIEPWTVEFVGSQGRSGSRAISVRAERCLDLNISPVIALAAIRVGKVASNAIRHLQQVTKGYPMDVVAESSSTVRRPSVAAFSVRNESGRPMLMWLPKRPTRTQVISGDEIEVDVDADQIMISTSPGNSDRSTLLRCYIALSGYNAIAVSMNEVGAHVVSFEPDSESESTDLAPLQMLWDVTMIDGVPCGLLRSMIRMVNETQSPIQVCSTADGKVRETILPGKSWCVPIQEVDHQFRLRPFLPISIESSEPQPNHSTRFAWSDKLPSADEFIKLARTVLNSSNTAGGSLRTKVPLTICKGVYENERFTLSVLPRVDWTGPMPATHEMKSSWLDLKFRAPIILENLLPRQLMFSIYLDGRAAGSGSIEPLQEIHIHTAGNNIEAVEMKLAFNNFSNDCEPAWGDLVKLSSVSRLSLGQSNAQQKELMGNLERKRTLATNYFRVYAPFWIKNRSDTDIRVRERWSGDPKSNIVLRGRPPDVAADPYICGSGKTLEFQQANGSTSKWSSLPKDLLEIDKAISIQLEDVSLIVDVRPAQGKFQRSLVVTIRTSHWIENRTQFWLQWCRKEALNKRGILLQSDVHQVAPAKRVAVHFSKSNSASQAICIRPAEPDGTSDWIWSLPIPFALYGELSSKMYRPKAQEQYIARVSSYNLFGGASCLQICPEDREHPPYRVVNDCSKRCIAFRQVGADKAHPWLIRPGKSTRYCWDEPHAPRKRKLLIVEVVETRGQREVSLPEFQLNIDVVSPVASRMAKHFSPALLISVDVDGPTKIVRFWDEPSASSLQNAPVGAPVVSWDDLGVEETSPITSKNLSDQQVAVDIDFWLHSIGVSVVDGRASELAYILASGVHLHIDSVRDSQLILFEVEDLQVDNQLSQPVWPVLLWSPPPGEDTEPPPRTPGPAGSSQLGSKRPVAQFTLERTGNDLRGITMCKGVYASLQQLQISVDEDFVLRLWQFFQLVLDSQGVTDEPLDGRDSEEWSVSTAQENTESAAGLHRLYVEQLFLGPVKLIVSFAASRSDSEWRFGHYRALVQTLVAVLGNVENAELRFNALELHHAFDAAQHLRSLIQEYYVRQILSQQLTLVASNSLVGNPSALFDSIAIGAKDFFFEPANATSGLDFIASVGRGSHSLLTNTVGGLFGSIGGIPRAMAQGLETAVGDKDYASERASIRGTQRSSSSAGQGLVTGALSFGHGLASGAAGLIRDPLEGAISSGARGFFKGIGKGVVGGVLKPLTGALDLIAEPAAGIRNMMVAQQSGIAEPSRPPRWIPKAGRSGGRLLPYNLRQAIGKSILDAINRNEEREHEHVVQWVELTPKSTRESQGRLLVLWVLLRRFTRGDGVLGQMMKNNRRKDAAGNQIKPEKDRLCLVTNQRVIIATLDGKLIWDCPVERVTECQVPGQAKEYLLLGLRQARQNYSELTPPQWHRIDCGSMEARDELDSYFRKSLMEKKMRWVSGQLEQGIELPDMKDVQRGKPTSNSRTNSSDHSEIEMSEVGNPPRNLCSDISERPFSKAVANTAIRDQSLESKVSYAVEEASRDALLRGRSVYVVVANRLDQGLVLVNMTVAFGKWAVPPPQRIEPKSVGCFKVDGSEDASRDIRGSVTYTWEEEAKGKVYIGFVNPMLAANSYPVRTTESLNVWYERGQGSRAVVIFSVALGQANEFQRLVRQPAIPDREVLLSPSVGRESAPADGGLGIFEGPPLSLGESGVSHELSESVTVVRKSSGVAIPESTEERETAVQELAGYGYEVDEARRALEATGYLMVEALRLLTRD